MNRGKLSDAIEKASDDYPGERRTETFEVIPVSVDTSTVVASVGDPGKPQPAAEVTTDSIDEFEATPPSRHLWVGLNVAGGAVSSTDLYGLQSGSLSIGGYIDRTKWLDFRLAYSHAPIQQTSELSQSLKGGVDILSLGADLKQFFTHPYTFIGAYFFGGASLQVMLWNYRNPIQVPTYRGYETISSDGQTGFDVHVGAGLVVGQSEPVHLTIELIPGLHVWAFRTFQGFENDIFGPLPYLIMRISLNSAILSW